MNSGQTTEWLRQYASTGSEVAFRELVTHYVDLVYSTALRSVRGDTAMAEDVTQRVFWDLSKKAKSLGPDVMLGGWLHRHACFVAANAVRGEQRRRRHEKEAVEMSAVTNSIENTWEEAAPVLDQAIETLDANDRTVILLRFFERLDFRSIGQAVGMSEDAARMRVNRALEKLHGLLKQRGITLPAAALGTFLTTDAVTAAPARLASAITAAAADMAASGGWSVLGFSSRLAANLGGLKAACLLLAVAGACIMGGYLLRPLTADQNSATTLNSSDSPISGGSNLPAVRSGRRTEANRTDAFALEDLKQRLRALLKEPLARGTYPIRQVERLLQEFRQQRLQSIPVLLEGLDVADYQTRRLALDGIWGLIINSGLPEEGGAHFRTQAVELARPRLLPILLSESEPVHLRRLAAQALVPAYGVKTMMGPSGPSSTEVTPMDPDALSGFLKVLESQNRQSEGFRFEVVDLLRQQAQYVPEDVQGVCAAMEPWLQDASFNRQFLSAFTLAICPGEKPHALLGILVRALDLEIKGEREGLYAYRAADALGMLGPVALEAVPSLLEYASAMRQRFPNGSEEKALFAVCRIAPELRPQYPAIDARLKQEELNAQAAPTAISLAKDSTNSREVPDAPQLPAVPDAEEKPRPISLRELLLDANIALVEHKTTNRFRLKELLNQWDAYYQAHPAEDSVTTSRFQELSRSIKGVDARFHEAWVAEVLRTSPNLDRIVGSSKANP